MAVWCDGALTAFATGGRGEDVERDRMGSAAVFAQAGRGVPGHILRWPRRGGRPAVMVEEIARTLAARAAAGVPLVVLDAPYDLSLLDRELGRHRDAGLPRYLGRSSLCVLDPLVLDRQLDRSRPGGRSLAELAAHYGVRLPGDLDAGARAVAALGLLRAMGRRFGPGLSRHSPAELHALQAVWHAVQVRAPQDWFAGTGPAGRVDPAWPLRPGVRTTKAGPSVDKPAC
ncbi:3'-5' exonuclease [Streptomyces gobiensis]|uniref:3'-5' exonuclease n=1 Tax=Streptomyces gobiensis TaxID=2875706 RepID=UPI001E49C3BA|nr:3'-5' exonuclease [Streptomyces gobiensis]UGY90413.1 3'-5' exonuclease [Streptomyces gobiensis]